MNPSISSLLWLLGLLALFTTVVGVHLDEDDPIEPLDNLNEEEFEEMFNVPPADDIDEEIRREEALKEHEAEVHEVNEEYLAGNKTWFEHLDEYSNLPDDEFKAERTGAVVPGAKTTFGRGLIMPTDPAEMYDADSEEYFAKARLSRADAPASYNAVTAGLVSPVKSQGQCGSCVAFASMAAVETCFKKLTGAAFGDYSEQQFVDCGFGKNGANGCDGASPHAYIKYGGEESLVPAHESQYPYLNTEPKLACPSGGLPKYNLGAKMAAAYYTYNADEETMKSEVYKNGAIVTAISTSGGFQDYAGGIFQGCTTDEYDHAVTVVGYGEENGVPYWLIKNSWGERWGEKGFIRLRRGVGMCGIGKIIGVAKCATNTGPTDAPLTTVAPCEDQYSNCPTLAETYCYKYKNECKKSCGLCPGMTPAASLTCYDTYSNCPDLAKNYCFKDSMKTTCMKSCGLCPGMTPAESNTCYDTYSNCPDLCGTSYATVCKKSCNLCLSAGRR